MEQNTRAWDRYLKGLGYKTKISLLATTDKNESFYSGNQWRGVKTNQLPKAIINVTKRIADYKISSVMSDLISMQFSAEGIGDTDEEGKVYREVASLLSQYTKTAWENLKVDTMNENGLLDAVLSGDMVSYWYWNDSIDVGNGQKGDLCGELINNCNYFPGDPNNPEINNAHEPVQPYIVLAFRKQVSDVKREAKLNGVTDLDMIVADSETQNQTGERSKIELEDDDGKCIVLLELWKEQIEEFEEQTTINEEGFEEIVQVSKGKKWHIFAEKSTRSVVIRKKWDTGLHRYPVALMNWYKRKGSAHGEAEVTSIIPNQLMINKQASMIALWIQLHGFPKVLYDKTRIGSWTNDLSLAIPVNGVDSGNVGGAAQYMQPGQISAAVMQFMTWFIQITKDMAGANDSALGEAPPTNTSAIIVNSKNAAVPLAPIKRRFYQYCEDIGLIWLDFWTSKYAEYPTRQLEITVDGQKQVVELDTEVLKSIKLKLKIDVGPASVWNEAAAAQTLDALLLKDQITFIEYLKRLPNGLIPDKQGLITDRESQEAQQKLEEKEFMYMMMAKFMEEIEATLPPEALNELKMLQRNQPEEYEKQAKQLIQQNAEKRPYTNNVEVEQ